MVINHLLTGMIRQVSTVAPVTGVCFFCWLKKLNEMSVDFLGGGNSNIFFIFTPDPWGDDGFWRTYFSNGLIQPPTSKIIGFVFVGWF